MGSKVTGKPHAVCVPYPAQGHVTPVLKLAKLLHAQGIHITFVNTEFNHRRLLNASGGSFAQIGVDDFRFETIPDGMPPSDENATQDIPSLCDSTTKNCLSPLLTLIARLNDPSSGVPPVTCIVGDGVMSFTFEAAQKLGIPGIMLWTASACGFLGYLHYQQLLHRGLVPFKDEKDHTNGYLDTPIDWIPGMKNIRLRDIPTFIRTTDREDIMLNFFIHECKRAPMASAIILNTFDELEKEALAALQPLLPPMYTAGPLSLLCKQLSQSGVVTTSSSLWKVDSDCMGWLDKKRRNSVLLVSFGSIAPLRKDQLVEFAWGLAKSGCEFIWIIRSDMMKHEKFVIPEEFVEETKERGLLLNWCEQEEVLMHPAIGGFLTHCGWNSMLEGICSGTPLLCWPFFAEQQTNCRYACTEWYNGLEVEGDVKREEVEGLVRGLMEGVKGEEMRKRALEWKKSAIMATMPGGSSYTNFYEVLNKVILSTK